MFSMQGILKLTQEATRVSGDINSKREAKGLLPRPVRCAVIGYPNVGKSAIINRLLKRRVANSAPRPGVTRELV
jgi:ribosome biogenesis GTPase A